MKINRILIRTSVFLLVILFMSCARTSGIFPKPAPPPPAVETTVQKESLPPQENQPKFNRQSQLCQKKRRL